MVPQRTDAESHSPIRERRKELRITQAELAEQVGVSRQTIVAVERGDYAPSVFLAIRVAQALERTVEELFAVEGDD